MKYLKLYEEEVNKPEVGDYIIINNSTDIYTLFSDRTRDYKGKYTQDWVEIKDIKTDIIYIINKIRIVFFSSNIEDCEAYLAANKYNL